MPIIQVINKICHFFTIGLLHINISNNKIPLIPHLLCLKTCKLTWNGSANEKVSNEKEKGGEEENLGEHHY